MDNNNNNANIDHNNDNSNNNYSSAPSNDNNSYQNPSGNEKSDGWGGQNNNTSSNDNYSRNNNSNYNRRWNGDRSRPPQDRSGKELYCGNLPGDVTDDELHDLFRKYGKIERIKVLGRRSDSKFAFVVFRSAEDALEAARGRDGIQFADRTIKVEISKSRERNRDRGNGDRFDRGGDRRFRDDRRRDDRGGYRDDRRRDDRGGSFRDDRRGNFRDDRRRDERGGRGNDRDRRPSTCIFVDNIIPGTRWESLAEAIEKVAKPIPGSVRINRSGRGATVRFEQKEDAERVVQELSGKELRGPRDEVTNLELRVAPPRNEHRRDDRGGRGRDFNRGRDDRRDNRDGGGRDDRRNNHSDGRRDDNNRGGRPRSRSRSPVRNHDRDERPSSRSRSLPRANNDEDTQVPSDSKAEDGGDKPMTVESNDVPQTGEKEAAATETQQAKDAETNNNDSNTSIDTATNGSNNDNNSDYDSMKYADLRALCKEKGISASGKKADLIQKLQEMA